MPRKRAKATTEEEPPKRKILKGIVTRMNDGSFIQDSGTTALVCTVEGAFQSPKRRIDTNVTFADGNMKTLSRGSSVRWT
mmetsp:Transcript_13549/g.54329  ORF Transcript_13549/g.54329 Transcript_13549/m.54329 type:complete len:80 (-) Transcript_13549:3041-3280(-)